MAAKKLLGQFIAGYFLFLFFLLGSQHPRLKYLFCLPLLYASLSIASGKTWGVNERTNALTPCVTLRKGCVQVWVGVDGLPDQLTLTQIDLITAAVTTGVIVCIQEEGWTWTPQPGAELMKEWRVGLAEPREHGQGRVCPGQAAGRGADHRREPAGPPAAWLPGCPASEPHSKWAQQQSWAPRPSSE